MAAESIVSASLRSSASDEVGNTIGNAAAGGGRVVAYNIIRNKHMLFHFVSKTTSGIEINDHPHSGPIYDSIASILLATSESRAEALRIYRTIKLHSFFQDSTSAARPDPMYIHPSIDIAWVCKARRRDTSDLFEVAMLLQPESIPIPEVADRLTVYISQLLDTGIKRVCFDIDIWTTMIDCENCHPALEKALGRFDVIIVDEDQTTCEGPWRELWANRAGRVVEGLNLDPSADLRSTMVHQMLLDYDTKLKDLLQEKGWIMRGEILWSGLEICIGFALM
ncbi:hypothetical protein BKA64DRAFT_719720 [Cadophora sp. MPI-SDFR-AT-0126]|nr:hypothetical protein BKA64DRAFT_719720 [Leotiomycetes sp. MPI-SDFR-AT-0126]